MKLRHRLKYWLRDSFRGFIKAIDPAFMVAMARPYGAAPVIGQNLSGNMKAIQHSIWAFICIDKIAENLAGLPIIFYEGYGKNKRVLEKDPIIDLIYRPNPLTTHRDLWVEVAWYILGTGAAHLLVDQLSPAGNIVPGKTKIWTLPSESVEIVVNQNYGKDSSENPILGYNLKLSDGTKKPINANNIITLKRFNPRDPFHGLAKMTVAEKVIEGDYYARLTTNKFWENGAVLGKELSVDVDYNEELDKRTRADWAAHQQGIHNMHNLAIFYNGMKPIDSNYKGLSDMGFERYINLNAEEIIALFGVDPSTVGRWKDAKYANAQLQDRYLWDHTMIPMKVHIECTFNEIVIPRWTNHEIWMEFDLSGVKALQEDLDKKYTREVSAVAGTVKTPNEARAALGLDPHPDPRANDLKFQVSPFIQPEPAKILQFKELEWRKQSWEIKDAFRSSKERNFIKIINSFWPDQKRRILKALSELSIDYKLTGYNTDLIFKPKDEEKSLDIITAGYCKTAFGEAGNRAVDEVNRNKTIHIIRVKQEDIIASSFNLADQMALDFLARHGAEFVTEVTETTRKLLAELIEAGYREGVSVDELTSRISDLFESFTEGRSYTISQTEMGYMTNNGSYQGYLQAGADKKDWLPTPDSNTRDSHAAMANHGAIMIDERFKVPIMQGGSLLGYDYMLHPHDSAGSAGNIISCRCSLEPIVTI